MKNVHAGEKRVCGGGAGSETPFRGSGFRLRFIKLHPVMCVCERVACLCEYSPSARGMKSGSARVLQYTRPAQCVFVCVCVCV